MSFGRIGRRILNMPAARRTVYEGRGLLLPELVHLGHQVSRSVVATSLAAHSHRGYELCLLVRGEVYWWAGPDLYRVGAGQWYLTRPGETHGGIDDVLHPCELYWV